jgi:hypothetical protein
MRVTLPSSRRASAALPSLKTAACIRAASKFFTSYPVITLPAKRPMPGKSLAPATSRACAVAPVGANNERTNRRTSGLAISDERAIENPCRFWGKIPANTQRAKQNAPDRS